MNRNNDFNELQSLWLEQTADQKPSGQKQGFPDALTAKLKSLQSFQDKVNQIKLIVISIIFLFIAYTLFTAGVYSFIAYGGLLVVFISTVWFFSFYLKNQLKVSRINFELPATDFLESAIDTLNRQNNVFGKPFTYFSLAMLLGINLLFLGLLNESAFSERFQVHAAFSLWVMLASIVGQRFRQRRIKKEVLPLIEELQKTRESLQENDR